jgi:parallel beta-helix repeat protein
MRSPSALALVLCAALSASAAERACDITLAPGQDVQRGIGRLPADGRLCLTAGEFRLPRFLAIARDGVTLSGAGPSTVLSLAEGVQSPVVVIGDHTSQVPRRVTSRVALEDLRIVGHGRGGSEVDHDHRYLTNSAVVVRGARNVTLRGLDVTACRSACLLTEHDCEDVVIEDNRVAGSVWDGIALNRTARARVVANTIDGNTAAGITAEHLERSVIADNVVSDNGTHGLYLSDSYRNVIARNWFADNVLSGVFLTCAIRYHKPLVQCWDDSLSADNVFERNEFVENRVGFTVATDAAAATCVVPGFVANRSRGDLFERNPSEDADWTAYGPCLRYEAGSGPSPGITPAANAGSLRGSAPRPAPSPG